MQIIVEELERMSDERFLAIYEALSENGFGPLDSEVARALKFRPQAIRKLPLPQRAKKARSILRGGHNAELTYELLGTYLVRRCKDLVTGFLDATGVPHEEGMIEDVDDAVPDPEKIPGAIEALDAAHDAEDVTLYLALCSQQWPEQPLLVEVWRERCAKSATS